MRVAGLLLALLGSLCLASAADEAPKPTDTAPLKAHLKELGVEAVSDQLLEVGLLTVNDVRLLTAEDMKELKFSAEHKTALNTWIDSKTGKTEIEIPVFSKDIEAKLQEEGIKSAADIRTLSEDDMMDMGMNIGQRNRVFNWIEHTANLDKGDGAKGGDEDDEFYDDEEEEEEEEEELPPEDPLKPRVRGFGMKMKRSAKEGNGEKYRKAKAEAKAKAKGQKQESSGQDPRIPDNAPAYKVDMKGKLVIAAFFVLFFGGLIYSNQTTKAADRKKYAKHEGKDTAEDIIGHHLQHSAKISKRKKPTSKKAGKSKGRF